MTILIPWIVLLLGLAWMGYQATKAKREANKKILEERLAARSAELVLSRIIDEELTREAKARQYRLALKHG